MKVEHLLLFNLNYFQCQYPVVDSGYRIDSRHPEQIKMAHGHAVRSLVTSHSLQRWLIAMRLLANEHISKYNT